MTIQLGDVIENTISRYKPNIQYDNDLFFFFAKDITIFITTQVGDNITQTATQKIYCHYTLS